MPRLQDIVLQLGLLSTSELNRVLFAFPDSSLLNAVLQVFGPERLGQIEQALSKTLGFEVIPDLELKISPEVLNVKALELAPLIKKYKAIPLRFESLSNKGASNSRQLLLALTDPTEEQARQTFAALYGMPVRAVLAREKAVVAAYALAAGRVNVAARSEAAKVKAVAFSDYSSYLEDPEVIKASQQILATAIKHSALNVGIDTSKPYTKVQFEFPDEKTSGVEISVSPLALAASLFRRSYITSSNPGVVKARGRVDFKSVKVDFELQANKPDSSKEKGLSGATLLLKDFVLDQPDNPVFWAGFSQEQSRSLRQLFDSPSGLVLVCGVKPSSLAFATRALLESYPACRVKKVCSNKDFVSALEESQERFILGVTEGLGTPGVLEQLLGIGEADFSHLKLILEYQRLPRVCPFCAEACSREESVWRDWSELSRVMKSKRASSCGVCEQSSVLGLVGASSLVNVSRKLLKSLHGFATKQSIYRAILEEGYQPLFKSALELVEAGALSVEMARQEIKLPPADFMEFCQGAQAQPAESFDLTLAEVDDDEPWQGPAHLRNSTALSKSGSRVSVSDSSVFRALSKTDSAPGGGLKQTGTGPAQSKEKPLLLLIDDDGDQRAILRRVFELAGYRVEVAADGIDGIVSAVRLLPSLIIVDFMMPELDGRETIKRLKSSGGTNSIPIVALTAYADPEVELGLLQAGADDFCPKSVSKQVLLKRIERLVGSGSLE